jgi:UPF0755 protein
VSVPEPTGSRNQRQGSISARELRGDTRSRRSSGWGGVAFLAVLLIVIGVVGVVGLGPVYKDYTYDLAKTNPLALKLPMVPDVIRERLGAALREPAGTDDTPITFVVPPGQSIPATGRALTDAGLIAEPLVFTYEVVTRGLDDELQTGTFTLDKTMTPADIAQRLALPPDPPRKQVLVALKVSLRLEQIAAYLQTIGLDMDVEEFYQLMLHPPQEILDAYPALKAIPKGGSLEGFMGQGTFSVDADITPEELLRLLLDDWQRDVGDDAMKAAEAAGLDLYDVLKLASIVERETADNAEKPKVAGVYTNRLNGLGGTRFLNSEPTVIYANDGTKLRKMPFTDWDKYRFWGLTGFADLSKVKVADDLMGYHSWYTEGLPPTPIDTPTLSSIRAAIKPDTRDGYLYFYACAGSGTTKFATTLAGQTRNINNCKK